MVKLRPVDAAALLSNLNLYNAEYSNLKKNEEVENEVKVVENFYS